MSFTSPKLVNRLDYLFAHRVWHSCPIGEQRICHTSPTDHVACQIITKPSVRHGSGPWRAPTWLLELPRAAEIIHGYLDRFLDKSLGFHNLAKAYDSLVSDIRIQLKEFHIQRVDKQRLPMKKLAFEIASLLQVPNMRQDPVLVGRVRDLQQQIEKLQTTQKEFRQEQAFKLHLYKAERSSKFHFMSPVPSPLKKPVFKEMEHSDGNLVSSQNGISIVLVDYYSGLFALPSSRPQGDDLSSFLGPLTRDKQLSDRAKVELAAPLRANEFYHAIRKSSSNSAPGPNALPFEVLKLAPHKWSRKNASTCPSQGHLHANPEDDQHTRSRHPSHRPGRLWNVPRDADARLQHPNERP
ncbi:Aste57867_15047 [Aphanomyces stellatus]|uniref:Aste57867_15047 protein n=1 Tax=Aphanomyces stellatus TaxID=120398 RepID=A0A485L4W9_9STRA|nr:hypothetical protein As57867_014991 [Aphanomyces stellatus]VFT91861.1 Aste57867_15047 [Aphanomyces stellatus]